MANYRNRKLLDLAHQVHRCQFKLFGCQVYVPEGCVPAHSNQSKHGKGMGIKANDDQHVASCHHCHQVYDGHTNIVIPRDESVDLFNEARERTFALYERHGWLEKVGYVEQAV